MKKYIKLFGRKNEMRGNMLVELLLCVALAAIVIPFAFRLQQGAVTRAQNIAITNQMSIIQSALERYIVAHREDLLKTVGKNITRVKLAQLVEYGIPDAILESDADLYQLRILKSSDAAGHSTLQGVVIRVSDDISPLRTREIVNLSGGTMGFVEDKHAYGTFGVWHTDSVDLGIDVKNAIVETTNVNRDSSLYLWRVPSGNADDAKMMSALNLGGHDIVNSTFVNAEFTEFTEGLKALQIATNDLIFQNRTTIDNAFKVASATVSGMMSSDAKSMEVSRGLLLSELGKFSSVTAQNLWVSNLTLGGLSISTEDDFSFLKINQSLDMTAGRISAMFVTVGFTGSMTPRLAVSKKIADSQQSDYYWDLSNKVANFADASFVELNRMASLATYHYGDSATESGSIFAAVSANKNATVADYMNAISEIQTRVRAKYRQLNLE